MTMSIVGRGDWRCGICQAVLQPEDDVETYHGERCHAECVAEEEREGR